MRRAASWGLAPRLLAATVAAVLVVAATAWAIAALVGPSVFHDHLAVSGVDDPDAVLHAERAFADAAGLSLTLGLVAGVLAAAAVSAFIARRAARSLTLATTAAGRVAAGDHSARVPAVGIGREFDELAAAFNTMAADLGSVESGRRRMLGDLAHEMRTPVATLEAYLEAIADGVQPADAETVAMLRGQVVRLARLAEDVALVTTAEEGRLAMRRAPVGVGTVVDAAHAQAAGRFAELGVDLAVRAAPDARSVVLDADADRLGQVLTNLLDNALRHTPAGGHVALEARRIGPGVAVTVADDGEGVSAEHLPHLFERFYRVDSARDRTRGGSGVGLAIVRAIVEAHGGTVRAASDGPGAGARFTVTLPVSVTPARVVGREEGNHGARSR
ncbi:ATP-binding protein [Georgenia sp. M64]|uniref:sensor histidine kinase n=1 Tax=Georgenia sp. M64 TaxID=3120520 RepID=UPI0030DF8E21